MDTMDIDIDLGDEPLVEAETLEAPVAPEPSHTVQESSAPPDGLEEAVLNKIHIRGVDELSTANIQAFALEHFPSHKPTVEWIDDTSANFIYDDADTAQKALLVFSSLAEGNASTLHQLQLREAKPLSSHPEAKLQIRTAVVTDRKKPRAREASRYYLLHPEEDPGEKRRSNRPQRRRRHSDDEVETFDASMYDDDEVTLAKRRIRDVSEDNIRSRRDRKSNYDRDRSASPGRAGSRGDLRRRNSRERDSNRGKELFGETRRSGSLLSGNNPTRELFPDAVKAAKNKESAGALKKDLFPLKAGSAADEASDLFSAKMTVPLVDGANDQRDRDGMNIRGSAAGEKGFSIKGADQGFSIRGSAGQKKTIKELFPEKTDSPNAGVELFGRTSRRNKAADLFG